MIGESILRKKSEKNIPYDEQWFLVGYKHHPQEDATRCDLCNHVIRHELILYNEKTKEHLRTAKDCARNVLGDHIFFKRDNRTYRFNLDGNIEKEYERVNLLYVDEQKKTVHDAILQTI